MINFIILIGAPILWAIAYKGYSARAWFTALSIWLLFISIHPVFHWVLSILILVITLPIVVLTWNNSIRKTFLVKPLLDKFKSVLPNMSSTEKAAIDAGGVWWDGELFSGAPNWDYLLNYKLPGLTENERLFIDGPVQRLCENLDDWKITNEINDLPEDIWKSLKEESFFGMIIPKEYGGLGFSALAHSAVVMKIASRSITAAVTVMVPNSLGPAKLLLHYGTDKQRDYYLSRLAKGIEIPCFALTSPVAGSDAGAIVDSGVVCYKKINGKEILGINLNFEKRYITLGPVSTLIGLAFKLFDPDHLLSEKTNRGITVVLLPSDTKGVETGDRHMPMNIPFQNGPVRGKNVFVALDNIIGGADRIGDGWKMLVECLSEGRAISLPALSTGAGKTASRYTGSYAKLRKQFNLPIGKFEGVQEPLARIAAFTYQMDAARTLTLAAIDQGEKPSVISAIIKYHLTEKYRQVINDAMDIQGGSGICLGPSNLIGRIYQAIPIGITVEGANILTRSMIIFGQGAIRCHPWILKEMLASQEKNNEKAIDHFDTAIFSHLAFLLSNAARCLFMVLTRSIFSKGTNDDFLSSHLKQLNWMSAAFSLSADVAMMTLGGALKRKERLSARLGDVLSELYISSAVLKQYVAHGSLIEERAIVNYSLNQSLYHIQQSLMALFRNLPSRTLGRILKWLIFPTGLPYSVPNDRNVSEVANVLMKGSKVRDLLTSGIFITDNDQEKMGQLELAFSLADEFLSAESIIKESRKAGILQGSDLIEQYKYACEIKLISNDELDKLIRLEELRTQIVSVDYFKQNQSDSIDKETVHESIHG